MDSQFLLFEEERKVSLDLKTPWVAWGFLHGPNFLGLLFLHVHCALSLALFVFVMCFCDLC